MAADLTTADVYEDASLIGQDIEKIIERFGHDAVMDLMPKIIRVLEKLELVVGEKEKSRLEIAELKLENERLYLEIKREASQRRKLDEELYQISSTGEADNLKTMLIKLQEENKKLRLEFEISANSQPATAYISAPGDAELMHKMKETIDNQRDSIRSKNMEIDSLRKDLEAMEEQIDRLTTINESVRKTLGASQARISVLAKEKAELQTELRSLKRTTSVLQVQTGQDENSIEEEGFTDSDNELQEQHSAEEGVDIEEENALQNTVENTEQIVHLSNENPPPKPPRLKIEPRAEENGDMLNNNGNEVNDGNKNWKDEQRENGLNYNRKGEEQELGDWEIVGETAETTYKKENSEEDQKEKCATNQTGREKDKKLDPNRPRYTKAEMLEVLIERNSLKERVFALQDELKIYKPSYAQEDEQKHFSDTNSSRRASRQESGISKIFSIFSHHRH